MVEPIKVPEQAFLGKLKQYVEERQESAPEQHQNWIDIPFDLANINKDFLKRKRAFVSGLTKIETERLTTGKPGKKQKPLGFQVCPDVLPIVPVNGLTNFNHKSVFDGSQPYLEESEERVRGDWEPVITYRYIGNNRVGCLYEMQ